MCSTVGVFSTVGDIMSTVGDIFEYCGGWSVPWGDIMINLGDILSTMGVFSTVGGIMSTVEGYLEYRGGVQYRGEYHDARGGYHEYRGGCSVPWGKNLLLFEYPTVLNAPHGTQISKDGIPPRYS